MCRVLIKEEFMNFKERMEMCVLTAMVQTERFPAVKTRLTV